MVPPSECPVLPFITTGYVKYVVRLQKMSQVLLVMHLWMSGMKEGLLTSMVTRPTGL